LQFLGEVKAELRVKAEQALARIEISLEDEIVSSRRAPSLPDDAMASNTEAVSESPAPVAGQLRPVALMSRDIATAIPSAPDNR
jgi:hypothetical protein